MWGTEQILLVIFAGLCSLIGNSCYALGGTQGFGLWVRRYLGSFIIALGASIVAIVRGDWSWQLILIYPALIGAFCLPYGASTTISKIFKRTLFALACVTAGVFGCWAMGWISWGILVMQLIVGLFSVYLGVKNPYKNAPAEEFLICNLLTLTVPFWGFVK